MRKFLILSLCLLAAACGGGKDAGQEPKGIISLNPAATEILFALGAGERVIAVSAFCNYPSSVLTLPKAGDAFTADIEKIARLNPEIVFVAEGSPVKQRLENLNIRAVEIADPHGLPAIMQNIDLLAAYADVPSEKLKNEMSANLQAAAKPVSPAPKVFIELYPGLWTAGQDSYINFLIETAGGQNIFAGEKSPYFKASWESFVRANPDIIISLIPNGSDFSPRPLSSEVNAIRNNKVFKFTQEEIDILSRPGPRTPQAVGILNKVFRNEK